MPQRQLTRQQTLDYQVQVATHDSAGGFLERLGEWMRYYRFFFLPPLVLALPFFLMRLREYRYAWVAITIAIFAIGSNVYPYFYSHFIAAEACLFVLMAVVGLERLGELQTDAVGVIVVLCFAHFVFWYGFHLAGNQEMIRYETGDAINQADPEGRIAIRKQLEDLPVKQLVFVRYWPPHRFQEWVYNRAEIDHAHIVWARDLGSAGNQKLRMYYPDRFLWLLEPDFRPPRLTPLLPSGR